MDSNGSVECPVCTLYLREGITLKQHLETHPKTQVIDALLRASNNNNDNSNVITTQAPQRPPGMPMLQPAPHLMAAVTYQQIMTTNASGGIVPQFLQIPTYVNPSYAVTQNFGFTPSSTFFNPLQNTYFSNQYPINNNNEVRHAEVETVEENLGVDEMDLSSPDPPTPSVIISRQNSTPVKSVSPKHLRTRSRNHSPIESVHNDSERSNCTSPERSIDREDLYSPKYNLVSSVAKDSDQIDFQHMNDLKGNYTSVEDIHSRSVTPQSEHDIFHPTSPVKDVNMKNEDSVIVEAKLQSVENIIKTDVKIECFDMARTSVEKTSIAGTSGIQDCNSTDLFRNYMDIPPDNEAQVDDGYYNDENYHESNSAVYTDLVPSKGSRAAEELAATTSQSYMELDGIRIFFNGSELPSPKASSVIQMADSTKFDLSPMNLNIAADESMPARGELSEQESLGADSSWGLYNQDVKVVDTWRPDIKSFKCSVCNETFSCPKQRRAHKNVAHRKPCREFRCTVCGAPFPSLRERREHTAIHTEQVKFEKLEEPTSTVRHCRHCAAAVPSVRALREHLRLVHGVARFRCRTCEVAFDEEVAFNEHLKIHPLKCTQCGKLFTRKTYLNLHMKRHLVIKPFSCNICPKAFITRQKLDEHVNGHAGIKPIKCILCDKTFSRHSNLIQHRNLHHNTLKKKLRDFVCRCGDVFPSQRKLDWHREIHETKPKSCPYCSQKFIHVASVTRHVRRAHFPDYLPEGQGRESENVSCPICDKIYLRGSLSVHMRVHNGERPFQCSICSKQFTTKWNMELHQWTHQSRSSMPFKCTLCKSAFFREADYISHANAHKNLKPFICNICGQKFIRKYNCLRHQEEHRRAKRFACTVSGCDRTFHRSYYLKDHMKVHTGLRPHTCHICGKASSTKSNHNKHVRIHDTREPINTEN